jgi:hypothetical protein
MVDLASLRRKAMSSTQRKFQEVIPPQRLDTIEVVKSICHSFKYMEVKIKDHSDTYLLSCKIEAI